MLRTPARAHQALTNLFDKACYRNVGYFNAGYWGESRRVLSNLRARF